MAISDNQQHETCLVVSLFFSNFSPASGVTDKTNRWRCSRWSVEGLNMWQDLEQGRIDWGLDYANKSNNRALTSRTVQQWPMHLWTVWKSIITSNIRLLRKTRRDFVCKSRNRDARRQNISRWVLHQCLSGLLLSTSEGNSQSFSPTETITGSPLQAPTPVEDKQIRRLFQHRLDNKLLASKNKLVRIIVWSLTEEPVRLVV